MDKIENKEKEIFKFNFLSSEEYISFSGEYINDIYSNLLLDEKNLKPLYGYIQNQHDINEQNDQKLKKLKAELETVKNSFNKENEKNNQANFLGQP